MEHYIRKLSGKQYLARLEKNPTVIIPTGACEVYGPQLPMGTDLLAAQKIAELIPVPSPCPARCWRTIWRPWWTS